MRFLRESDAEITMSAALMSCGGAHAAVQAARHERERRHQFLVIPGPPQAEPGIQRCLVTCAFARRFRGSLDSGFALTRAPE
jgi:hypothetical protein